MAVIELRWLDGPMIVVEGVLPDGLHADIPRKKILQYRNGTYIDVAEPPAPPRFQWSGSEWKDVQIVLWEDIR